MPDLRPGEFAIKIVNYKCFGEEAQGFEQVAPLNLIVGRNNSGKSALLDLLQLATSFKGIDKSLYHDGKPSKLIVTVLLQEEFLRQQVAEPAAPIAPQRITPQATRQHQAASQAYQKAHGEWRQYLSNKDRPAEFTVGTDSKLAFHQMADGSPPAGLIGKSLSQVQASALLRIAGKKFFRLNADRDIIPESENPTPYLNPNGSGFTNAVQRLLSQAELPHQLIDEDLLEGLNSIFAPDAVFEGIVARQRGSQWEIYLREKQKGLIPLSNSGSGLKTVLLVLATFILLPFIDRRPLGNYIFAFEELENNLHPALQRRLVGYVRDMCLKNGCIALLTTHSSAIIDLLSRDKDAQILHVTHSGKLAKVQRVTSYIENKGVLDDLDVRASDLLQANGVVWVEGPSDRLYFNRWMELISQGTLAEGAHYQCVFYGGRLLAHLSGDAPFDASLGDHAVKIFGINRNAIALIDSDLTTGSEKINSTKKRIVAELEANGGIAWVTAGKEIENYISSRTLERLYPGLLGADQFEDFSDHLGTYQGGLGKRFERGKVQFAERIAEITEINDLDVLDLHQRIVAAASRIARWNGLNLPFRS